mmetsp:Transcript_50956/g.119464  ORF Transcript_50956/g.119464 Transcript_50956/m.119464 type:complete len:226 (+) Transcript_50956:643-1320(+)
MAGQIQLDAAETGDQPRLGRGCRCHRVQAGDLVDGPEVHPSRPQHAQTGGGVADLVGRQALLLQPGQRPRFPLDHDDRPAQVGRGFDPPAVVGARIQRDAGAADLAHPAEQRFPLRCARQGDDAVAVLLLDGQQCPRRRHGLHAQGQARDLGQPLHHACTDAADLAGGRHVEHARAREHDDGGARRQRQRRPGDRQQQREEQEEPDTGHATGPACWRGRMGQARG